MPDGRLRHGPARVMSPERTNSVWKVASYFKIVVNHDDYPKHFKWKLGKCEFCQNYIILEFRSRSPSPQRNFPNLLHSPSPIPLTAMHKAGKAASAAAPVSFARKIRTVGEVGNDLKREYLRRKIAVQHELDLTSM